MTETVVYDTGTAKIGGIMYAANGERKPLIIALHGGGFSSAYYQAPGYSMVDALIKHELDAVLLDRPNYGISHFCEPQAEVFKANAAALNDAISRIWADDAGRHSGVVLVGHSIGGAIALLIAAAEKFWPLLGVSVAGIGDLPPENLQLPVGEMIPGEPILLSREAARHVFFAPGAASDAALDRMLAASAPVNGPEVGEVYRVWPSIVHETLTAISVPVQLILAQYEALWQADDAAIARLRGSMTGAPQTDVRIFPNVGHCIEFHPESAEYYAQVMAFSAAR